jgi:uncharacterized membrane protein HdeD (DUF308 family)
MATAAVARRVAPHGTWWVVLLEGIFSLLIGLFLLTAPGSTVVILTCLVGWFWLISGLLSIVSIFTRDTGIYWGWLLMNGVLILLVNTPLTALATIVTWVGITGIVGGIVLIVMGLRLRTC